MNKYLMGASPETRAEFHRLMKESQEPLANEIIQRLEQKNQAGRNAALEEEYNIRLSSLRQGDHYGISKLKAEFRKRGLSKW